LSVSDEELIQKEKKVNNRMNDLKFVDTPFEKSTKSVTFIVIPTDTTRDQPGYGQHIAG